MLLVVGFGHNKVSVAMVLIILGDVESPASRRARPLGLSFVNAS